MQSQSCFAGIKTKVYPLVSLVSAGGGVHWNYALTTAPCQVRSRVGGIVANHEEFPRVENDTWTCHTSP
jgi:hypothetical protein